MVAQANRAHVNVLFHTRARRLFRGQAALQNETRAQDEYVDPSYSKALLDNNNS